MNRNYREQQFLGPQTVSLYRGLTYSVPFSEGPLLEVRISHTQTHMHILKHMYTTVAHLQHGDQLRF